MLKAVYSGSYYTHQCICQLWPCSNSMEWNLHPGLSKADDEFSTAIQPRFWYEKEPCKNPDIFAGHLCYTKKPIQPLLGPLSTETVRNCAFLFAWKKSHGDDAIMSTHKLVQQMNFSKNCAAPRCDAKQQSATSFWSCLAAVCSKSPTWWQDFSASHFWDVSRFYMDAHHTRKAKHTTRILSNHIQDPVQADSKNKFWESCNKNCWVISWYQLPSKPSPSLKDQIHAKK